MSSFVSVPPSPFKCDGTRMFLQAVLVHPLYLTLLLSVTVFLAFGPTIVFMNNYTELGESATLGNVVGYFSVGFIMLEFFVRVFVEWNDYYTSTLFLLDVVVIFSCIPIMKDGLIKSSTAQITDDGFNDGTLDTDLTTSAPITLLSELTEYPDSIYMNIGSIFFFPSDLTSKLSFILIASVRISKFARFMEYLLRIYYAHRSFALSFIDEIDPDNIQMPMEDEEKIQGEDDSEDGLGFSRQSSLTEDGQNRLVVHFIDSATYRNQQYCRRFYINPAHHPPPPTTHQPPTTNHQPPTTNQKR